MDKQKLNVVRWITRVISTITLVFGLFFYFGYGNPLPFMNPENSLWDNIWLIVFPLMFVGLGLGWKYEKMAGYLIVVPITIASIIGFISIKEGLPGPMFVPLVIGIIYLVIGYSEMKK